MEKLAAHRATKNVGPQIRVQGKSGQTIGGVSQNVGGGRMDLGVSEPFGYTHTCASGTEIIKIGDSTGAVAAKTGKSVTAYDTGTAYTNTVLNEILREPIAVGTINYEVAATSDFTQAMEYAAANAGGAYAVKPINSVFTMSKRNTQQNSLLLTGEWPEGLVFGPKSCLFHTVPVTTVTVNFQPVELYEV